MVVFVEKSSEGKVIYLKQNKVTIVPFEHIETRGSKTNIAILRPPTPENEAIIMYTSGSTGDPKGNIFQFQILTADMRPKLPVEFNFGLLGRFMWVCGASKINFDAEKFSIL